MSGGGRALATAIGCGALAIWASLALLTTMVAAIPPFQLTAMSFAIAASLAVAKWILRREDPRPLLRMPAGAWLVGVGGLFLYHALYFAAFTRAPPVAVNLITYLWPLLIVIGAGLMPGERIAPRHLVGALSGLLGVVVLTGAGLSFEARYLPGYALALGCAIMWALYSVLSRRYAGVPSDGVAAFCAGTALLATLAHLLLEPSVVPDARGWLAVALLGLGPVGAAFYLWDHGVKHGDLRLLGTLSYLTPLGSTAVLVLAGRAEASWRLAAACALVVGGALVASRGGAPRRRSVAGGRTEGF
jgi:drug/metabolite transporter (DMT)-like permease